MKSIRLLVGIAATVAATSIADAAGGWEQFHGNDGNNGRADKGPDLRVYGTPRFAAPVDGIVADYYMGLNASGPVVSDGRVFCYGGGDIDAYWNDVGPGYLIAFDESTGMRLWTKQIEHGSYSSSSSPSVSKGRVYVPSGGAVYCLDAATGGEVWTSALNDAVVNAAVTVAEDLGLCYIHTWGSPTRLHALCIADGSPVWTLDMPGRGQGHVAYNAAAGLVYTTITDASRGRLVAVDAVGGTNVWTSADSFQNQCSGGIAFDAGLNWVVAIGYNSATEYAGILVCNASDGTTVSYSGNNSAPAGNFTPAIGADGTVYACGAEWDLDAYVAAFDGYTGADKWWSEEYGGWGTWSVSPVLAQDIGGGRGAVYSPSSFIMDGYFAWSGNGYAMFDAADGELLATVPMTGGSAALANGNLYFINADFNLVAFGPPVHIIEVDCGEHGTVLPSCRQGVADGESVTFTFDGSVKDVLVNGQSVGAAASYTFENVTGNETLTVAFHPTASAVADGPGTVTPAQAAIVNGNAVTLTATPSKDALFVDWSNGVETFYTAAITVAPEANTTYTARFRNKADCTAPETVVATAPVNHVVGVPLVMQVEVNDAAKPVKYSASKLPAGLKIDPVTGVISGVPAKAGVYSAIIKATSAANPKNAVSVILPIAIEALPLNAQGAFSGCVLDSGTAALSGSFTATISAAGKFTAKAITAGGTWTFSAPSFAGKQGNVFTVNATAAKGGQKLTLELDASAPYNQRQMSGDLNALYNVEAQRNAYLNQNNADFNNALNALRANLGYYTVALGGTVVAGSTGDALNVPQGYGFLTLTVNEKGAVKLAGRLADDTAFSGSTTLLLRPAEGEVLCFTPLYKANGFFCGDLAIDAAGMLLGNGTWTYPGKTPAGKSIATEDRFSMDIAADGARYNTLANLAADYAGLQFNAQGNAIALLDNGKGSLALAPNTVGATFTANAKTGLFSGKLASTAHRGALVQVPGGASFGAGYYLAPEKWGSYTIKRSHPVTVE